VRRAEGAARRTADAEISLLGEQLRAERAVCAACNRARGGLSAIKLLLSELGRSIGSFPVTCHRNELA
jgi:hypothetical protein